MGFIMKNYSITFKSLRGGTGGTTYVVSIGGGSGAAVALKGGASPFYTQEEGSDDMFMPMRTSSGYLRIVDDGLAADGLTEFDWKDLIPSTDLSRPVILTANGVTVWQGYMQAQDFGNTLYGNPQTRDYPVMCPLSAMSASDVDTSERNMRNFAYILKHAIDSLPGISISQVVVQGGSQAREWLMKMVDWQSMLDVGDEGVTARYNNLQAVSDMCQFWGWQCRYMGTTIYLTCADDENVTGWLTLTSAQLTTLAGGSRAGTVSSGGYDTAVIGGFASTDNEETLVSGYSKVTIESDAKEADDYIAEAFPSSVESEMMSGGRTEQYDNGIIAYVSDDMTTFDTPALKGRCTSGGATFNMMKIRERTGDASWLIDRETVSAIRIKKSYNGTPLASFDVGFEHSFHDTTIASGGFDSGGIFIYGDAYIKGTVYDGDLKHIIFRVGIGMTRETATFQTYRAIVGGETKGRKFLFDINTNNDTSKGYLFIDVMGSDDMPEFNGQRIFELVNFRIEFVRRTYEYLLEKSERAATREYKASNSNNVEEEYDCYLNYASDNEMVFGYGVIVNPSDGTQLGKQTYGSAEAWPEQHLADRIARYWGTSKRRLRMELLSPQTSVSPKSIAQIDGSRFYPISISRDWWNDVIQVNLMQL